MAITEKVKITDVFLEDFINEDFMKQLKQEIDTDVVPISLVFMKKHSVPIIISHENPQELENKIVHISSPDEETIKKLTKIIEKK